MATGGGDELRLSLSPPPRWGLVSYQPLLWMPHFAMRMLLARVYGMSRHDMAWRDRASPGACSPGDAAFAAVAAITIFDRTAPVIILRHGAPAPLYLVMIRDLAHGRGVLSRVLSLPGMRTLGHSSFAIFVLQYPAVSYLNFLRRTSLPETGPMLPLVILAIVLTSVLSTRVFEKPVSSWLRARLILPKRGGLPSSGRPPE